MSCQSLQFILTTYSPACQEKITTYIHALTLSSLCVCARTVCVYFHCLPQIIVHPSPHPAIQGVREAMVQSRTMSASMVRWSRLSVWGPSVSHLLSVWPADRDWWCNHATLGSTLQRDLSVSSALANGCFAVIHHCNGLGEMWVIGWRHEHIYACVHMCSYKHVSMKFLPRMVKSGQHTFTSPPPHTLYYDHTLKRLLQDSEMALYASDFDGL